MSAHHVVSAKREIKRAELCLQNAPIAYSRRDADDYLTQAAKHIQTARNLLTKADGREWNQQLGGNPVL